MVTFYFVRHGKTEENSRGIFQGSLDVPLNETGLVQAEYVARRMEQISLTAIYSSPLQRARVTAESICRRHTGLSLCLDADLAEINCGYLEGNDGETNRNRYPDVMDCLVKTPGLFQAPGGESAVQAYERASACLDRIAKRHPGKNICIVTHGFMMQVIHCLMLGLPCRETRHLIVGNASLSCAEYQNGNYSIVFFDDASHLPPELQFGVSDSFFANHQSSL